MRRLDSDRKNWASIRSFVVTPVGAADTATDALQLAFDHRPETSFHSTGSLSFEVPSGITAYTFLLSLPTNEPVCLRQYDKRGRLKAEIKTNEPFFTAKVDKKVTRMELVGKAEVYEIIPKK